MISRPACLLPLALVAAACTDPEVRRVRTDGPIMVADSDRPLVQSGKSGPMPIEEAPLFRTDPGRPPVAMSADEERRAPPPPAPGTIAEEPKPR